VSDARPDFAEILDAFGVSATVTRRDQAAISVTGVWVNPSMDAVPIGAGIQVSSRHRLIAFSRDEVGTLPKGTRIVAPEREGDAPKAWIVDEPDMEDADSIRVLVLPDRERPVEDEVS
jgi:hypothetical protein